jgi:hypothetical protein
MSKTVLADALDDGEKNGHVFQVRYEEKLFTILLGMPQEKVGVGNFISDGFLAI